MADIKTKKNKSILPVTYKFLTKDVNKITFDETEGKVTGYLAVFGVKDDAYDILIKGCFSKSLQDRGPDSTTHRKIAFLWMHDMKDPIGRFTILKEDDYGLYFEAILDDPESVPSAKRAASQLQSGTLDQFSIGYDYVWENNKMVWDDNLEAWIVKEVILWEGSVVTLGCNEFTYYAGMKDIEKYEAKSKLKKDTEDFIQSIPTKYQFQLRQIIAKNIEFSGIINKKDNTAADDDNPVIQFLDNTIDHLQSGIDLSDNYNDSEDYDDDNDLDEDITSLKEYHSDMMTKMLSHKTRLQDGEKSLINSRTTKRKPTAKTKPVADSTIKQLFNNLEISK